MRDKYLNILSSEDRIFSTASDNAAEYRDAFSDIADFVVSPVVYMYTSWIVDCAEKSGLERIYFFSRDGYLMYLTAQKICKKRNNGIICSYFYCSRYSLRMAAYWFKDDCAYDMLFYYAYRMSAKMMLQRAEFSETERKKVYADIEYSDDENTPFGRNEFSEFTDKVKQSEVFNTILYDKSYAAYEKFCRYTVQEGMPELKKAAVADLGWNGSMQYTLRKLLDSMGIRTDLHGYYLGMFSYPSECSRNYYSHWLFGPCHRMIRSWFAHNLLECVCSAPHGMTLGYDCSGEAVTPILAENENSNEPVNIISGSLKRFESLSDSEYKSSYRRTALKLLFNLMVRPDSKETTALDRYSFCDDVAEQYHGSIAPKVKKEDLKKEIIPFKLFHRNSSDGLYWYYGSVAASGYKTGFIYKLGYTISRYMINVFK